MKKTFFVAVILAMSFMIAMSPEALAGKKQIPSGYVDMGLPSGTLWKNQNETGDLYSYDQAQAEFGKNMPTKEQYEELISVCQWTWMGDGYKVEGPNGQFIILPAAGSQICSDEAGSVDPYGYYWSSSSEGSRDSWRLFFDASEVVMIHHYRCGERSVRLVR